MFQEVYVTGFIKVRFRGIIKRDKRTPPLLPGEKSVGYPAGKIRPMLTIF